jgi:predicted CXXCH cytochrome family protein
MKHLGKLPFILLGISLIGVGLGVAQEATTTREYAGSGECRECHRDIARPFSDGAHARTLVDMTSDVEPEENPIVADFSVESDARVVNFPGEDEARAFTADDVAYTLGVGRHVQSYVYEGDDDYYVFPAQWDTVNDEWMPLELGDSWLSEDYAFGPNCASCHVVGMDVETYTWQEDGAQCETCHGPGMEHVLAADDAGGRIEPEERARIYDSINFALDGETCGQCHSRGIAADGAHPYPVDYVPGQELAASFEVYGPANEDVWFSTGHASDPNMQYNEALQSTHPNALAGAQESDYFEEGCLSCHSATQHLIDRRLANEDIDPETVDPLALVDEHPNGVTCASCHNPHLSAEDDAPDTTANLRQTSYELCTSCHQDNDITDGIHYPVREVFEGMPIVDGIEGDPSAHFEAEDGPTCATCHMPSVPTYNGERHSHTFNIIMPGTALDIDVLENSCSTCHSEEPLALQDLINDIQADTEQRIEAARAAVGDDTPDWVVRALDYVEGDGSAGIHNYAYTDTLLDNVEVELNLTETEAE